MTPGFTVAGTDTGVGKTVFAAGLAAALGGIYWKPVQAGLDGETDSGTAARLGALGADRVHREAYVLRMAASPHIAAAAEGITIAADRLALPAGRPLVVETAGGVLAPLAPGLLQVDMMAAWALPVIVCARTSLGTINHTLLTLEALRRRGLVVHGVAFIGAAEDRVERSICEIGAATRLGRLGWLDLVDPNHLNRAFQAGFDIGDFIAHRDRR